jgi:hypothetical protein
MLPPSGFVKAQFSELRKYPLPVPLTITYYDTFRFGQVSAVIVRKTGHAEIVNRSHYRVIDLDILITSVHDVVLLDRIE